ALLFMLSIEEGVATRILAHLSAEEVGVLRSVSDTLQQVNPQAIVEVHREFVTKVGSGVPTSLRGSGAYLRRLAGQALGEGKIAELWEDSKGAEGPVAALSKLEPSILAAILENEAPQTLAVVFSLFEPQKAADVLAEFPVDRQADVVRRISQLKSVPAQV